MNSSKKRNSCIIVPQSICSNPMTLNSSIWCGKGENDVKKKSTTLTKGSLTKNFFWIALTMFNEIFLCESKQWNWETAFSWQTAAVIRNLTFITADSISKNSF